MRTTVLAFLVISAAAVYACGGNEPQPAAPSAPSTDIDAGAPAMPSTGSSSGGASTTPPPAGDAGGATASGEAKATAEGFDSLSKDKKLDIMMTKVVPNVGKLFKEHDAKKYGKFGCKTCHGDAKEKSKDDPKKVLPKLAMSNGGFEKLQKTKGPMVKFMAEKVVPAMAEALGEKPWDEKTHTGFGCGGCHTVN